MDKAVLQKQVDRIKQETRDNEYIIKGKLQERDDQIQKLMKKQEHFERMIQSLIDSDVLSSPPEIVSRDCKKGEH